MRIPHRLTAGKNGLHFTFPVDQAGLDPGAEEHRPARTEPGRRLGGARRPARLGRPRRPGDDLVVHPNVAWSPERCGNTPLHPSAHARARLGEHCGDSRTVVDREADMGGCPGSYSRGLVVTDMIAEVCIST